MDIKIGAVHSRFEIKLATESPNSTEMHTLAQSLTHSLTHSHTCTRLFRIAEICVTAFHLVYDCFDLFFSNLNFQYTISICGHSRFPASIRSLLMNLLQGFNALQNGLANQNREFTLDFDGGFSKSINLIAYSKINVFG